MRIFNIDSRGRWFRSGSLNDDTESRVREFLRRKLSLDPQRLDLDANLGGLGVDGDDGWELIEAFGKEFEVDLSAFAAAKHFGPEAGVSLFSLLKCLFGILRRRAPHEVWGLTPITFRDLIEAAEAKRWTL